MDEIRKGEMKMLAQSFLTAAELNITEPQYDALKKTLVLMETGKMKHVSEHEARFHVYNSWRESDANPHFDGNFSMVTWGAHTACGTVGCIGGTAEAISGVSFKGWEDDVNFELRNLFAPSSIVFHKWGAIDVDQAATALRSYLTTGHANWVTELSL
jgi:hypothetical protein